MKNIICSFILGVMTLSMINAQDPAKDVKKADGDFARDWYLAEMKK